MSGGWVYIMTNRPNGVLYTGVTSDITRRAFEHREGLVPGFTKRYGLKRLVYMSFTSESPTPFNAKRTSTIGLALGRRDWSLKRIRDGWICMRR